MPRKNHIQKPKTARMPLAVHAAMLRCSQKRSFPNEHSAQRAADYAMGEHTGIELETYKCDTCSKWHLTSR